MAPQYLGQNFLADASWRQRIARTLTAERAAPAGAPAVGADAASESGAGGVWVEIGAGHGELTEHLAKAAERVVAIELDPVLVPQLTRRTAPLGNVKVIAGDVLECDLAELAGADRFWVYGNLPYYITSPIVHRILPHADRLLGVYLVIQLEVAERMVAPPGSRERGYFSVFTQFYSEPEILFRIPPGAFRPRPKVTSALIALRPPGERARLQIADDRAFVSFLKVCFAQKRKMLHNNLHAMLSATRSRSAIEQAGIPSGARAEELTLEQLGRLFAACQDAASLTAAASRETLSSP